MVNIYIVCNHMPLYTQLLRDNVKVHCIKTCSFKPTVKTTIIQTPF